MAADHRPLDTDEFISHFEEMPSRLPEEKARGQRGKTGAIRYGEGLQISQGSTMLGQQSPSIDLKKRWRPDLPFR